LGRRSLVPYRPRRHKMHPLVPLAVLFVWMGPPALIETFTLPLKEDLPAAQALLWSNITMILSGVITGALVLVYAQFSFARGLKGLGIRLRGLGRDFVFAAINLLAVWPLVMVMILAVTLIGRLYSGDTFQIDPHPGLEQIVQNPNGLLAAVVMIMAIVIAPLSEELVFRGILQSLVASYTQIPWLAIGVTSLIFAMVHGDPTHWPPLFALSMGIGYSYEKSGSLWRPIFMHALFNGVTVVSNLLG
ncbi:MAG: CPBP family intramembrane metalloprotease, partial [Chlorobiales bacterium]|nr:CPBP family intramembrane metalloprotease [Chlorobiales bacterium]